VPAHGTVRVGGAESPVGAHGEFFFEDLEPGEHAAEVFFHGRSCRFTFTVRDGAEQQAGILKLGEISCRVPLLEDVPGDAPRARLAAPPMPAPSAAPSPEQYAVHVGSFRSRATADRESERLAAALTRPGLVRAVDLGEKGVWYRVFIGRFPSRREADDFRKGLLESRLVQTVGEVARLEAAS
jgi:SPOR domain